MRKIDPISVRDDFLSQLDEIRAFYASGLIGFKTEADHSRLTEHMLLALAVSWEGFVSDMFIAYINRDPAKFKVHLEASFRSHLKDSNKPKAVFDRFGKLSFPKHLSKADVQALANSSGNNITFSSYARLLEGAQAMLVAAHCAKFSSLSAQKRAIVDALISIRNHVAHRSDRSGEAMNNALLVGALYTTGLKRGVNKTYNVGVWLKSKPTVRHKSRLDILIDSLEQIARTF